MPSNFSPLELDISLTHPYLIALQTFKPGLNGSEQPKEVTRASGLLHMERLGLVAYFNDGQRWQLTEGGRRLLRAAQIAARKRLRSKS